MRCTPCILAPQTTAGLSRSTAGSLPLPLNEAQTAGTSTSSTPNHPRSPRRESGGSSPTIDPSMSSREIFASFRRNDESPPLLLPMLVPTNKAAPAAVAAAAAASKGGHGGEDVALAATLDKAAAVAAAAAAAAEKAAEKAAQAAAEKMAEARAAARAAKAAAEKAAAVTPGKGKPPATQTTTTPSAGSVQRKPKPEDGGFPPGAAGALEADIYEEADIYGENSPRAAVRKKRRARKPKPADRAVNRTAGSPSFQSKVARQSAVDGAARPSRRTAAC